MEIGIFTKTFSRPTLGETLDAATSYGLRSVQFNLTCGGLPSDLPLPGEVGLDDCTRIRAEMDARGITIAAVSGTFNMIDPDPEKRRDGLRRLGVLAEACPRLGASIVTLCTGSRDPVNMWRRHPDNDSAEAWSDLTASMSEAVTIAERENVTLVIEPEVSNVVDSALKARRLLDEIGSPNLKVVIDGANLFHAGELPRMREILDEAFDLLGEDIVQAHAKDLSHDGEAGQLAAGTGLLDYDRYLGLLHSIGFNGTILLHGLRESQVESCVAFLRDGIRRTLAG
jgi:sugar phosphate isomerase/epimerase